MANEIKVFNLTDVETPALKRFGLSNRGLQVEDQLILPGESATFAPAVWRAGTTKYKRLISLGALFVGDAAPPTYLNARPKPRDPGVRESVPTLVPEIPAAKAPSTPPAAPAATK